MTGKDDKIVNLSDFKERGHSDIQTMVQIHDKIASINHKKARERLEIAWYEVATTFYPDSCL